MPNSRRQESFGAARAALAKVISHVGDHRDRSRTWLVRSFDRLRLCLRPALEEEAAMLFDYWLAGLVTAGLLAYLTYALIRPEKF